MVQVQERELMKVYVDQTLCQGHGRCVVFAPTVFTLDEEDGLSRAKENISLDEEEAVRAAEMACPEQAISVDEEPRSG
jgi:ferredoxin